MKLAMKAFSSQKSESTFRARVAQQDRHGQEFDLGRFWVGEEKTWPLKPLKIWYAREDSNL